MKEGLEPKDEVAPDGVECLMGKRDLLLPNVQLVDVETIIWHGLHRPQDDPSDGARRDGKRRPRRPTPEVDLGSPLRGNPLLQEALVPPKLTAGVAVDEEELLELEREEPPPEDAVPAVLTPEMAPPGGATGLPYTEHLLSQLSGVLPAMSSSQVSSVLSALEPNSGPDRLQPASQGREGEERPPRCQGGKRRAKESPDGGGVKTESGPRPAVSQADKYEECKAGASSRWFRCKACPFVTSEVALVEDHCLMEDHRRRPPTKLTCIACSNVFLSTASLKAHLTFDHQVLAVDLHPMITTTILVNRIWKTESKFKDKLNGAAAQAESARDGAEGSGREENPFHATPTFSLFETVEKYMGQRETEAKGEKPEQPLESRPEEEDGKKCPADVKPAKRALPKQDVKIEKEAGQKCDVEGCTLRFVFPTTMEYHKKCHSGSEWKCPACDLTSSSWSQLAVHLWKIHAVDLELYSCQQCNYKTTSLSRLMNDHKRTHGEDRPFLCDLCGKGFKNTHQLRNHKSIHKAKKNLGRECEVCGRRFTELRMLKQHTDIVHRKLRPFLCSICGHAAGSKGSFRIHARTHTGEKPYRCPHCEYTTNDHNSLRRHKMQHTGAKHYTCPFCPYACIQATTYKAHLRNKHPGMDIGLMFSCDYCNFKTLKKENFITHASKHAAENGRAITEVQPTEPQQS